MTAAAPTTTEALRVEGVSRRFHKTCALDDVSFGVPEASLTVLLGAAGAGKTTTLRLIAGLDRQDRGVVRLKGRDLGAREPKDRDVAMIFDNLALYPDKSAFENIASPLRIRRVPAAEIESRVRALASTLRIAHLLQRLPKTMSGGERQRVALGRALVRQPGLCLLDEPLSSLDAMLRVELRAELRRLQRELGYTFLLATPDFAEALAIADTVVMLRAGRVVQTGAPQVLYDEPADRDIARFVGAPEINLLPGRLLSSPAAGSPQLCVAGASLTIPGALRDPLAQLSTPFDVGVRPESIRLANAHGASTPAVVIDIEPLGLKSTVTVRNDEAELRLVVEASVARGLSVGENVGIDLAAAPLLLFDRASGLRLHRRHT